MRKLMIFIFRRDLHGQKPAVTHVSKQNLIMFENQSKKGEAKFWFVFALIVRPIQNSVCKNTFIGSI